MSARLDEQSSRRRTRRPIGRGGRQVRLRQTMSSAECAIVPTTQRLRMTGGSSSRLPTGGIMKLASRTCGTGPLIREHRLTSGTVSGFGLRGLIAMAGCALAVVRTTGSSSRSITRTATARRIGRSWLEVTSTPVALPSCVLFVSKAFRKARSSCSAGTAIPDGLTTAGSVPTWRSK